MVTSISLLLWSVLAGQVVGQVVGQACYYSDNGVITEAPDMRPCGSTANGPSNCCTIGDVCETANICHFFHTNPLPTGNYSKYYMGGCTDLSYSNSTVCTPYCTTVDSGGSGRQTDVVYNTTSQEWACCGATGPGPHCDTPTDETFQALAPSAFTNTVILQSTTSTSSSSSTSSTSATSTTTSSTSTTFSPTSAATATPAVADSGLSSGAKAGVGVGAAVGALALASAAAFYFLRRRRSKREAANLVAADQSAQNDLSNHQYWTAYGANASMYGESTVPGKYGPGLPPMEMAGTYVPPPTRTPTHEMAALENHPTELDGVLGPGELEAGERQPAAQSRFTTGTSAVSALQSPPQSPPPSQHHSPLPSPHLQRKPVPQSRSQTDLGAASQH